MSDFSDRPFVAGSITGLRSFRVEKDGTLLGPVTGYRFAPGENVAVCTPYWSLFADLLDHQVGQLSCGCGYYAYFDLEANPFHHPDTAVYGLIQGYGVTTVGSRGFRAEKAKLLALVSPPPGPRLSLLDRMAKPLYEAVWPIIVGAFTLVVSFFGGDGLIGLGHPVWASLCYVVTVLSIFLLHLSLRSIGVHYSTDFDKVKAKYSDVPVYDTIDDALKDFPMKAPTPAPSPACPDLDREYYNIGGAS